MTFESHITLLRPIKVLIFGMKKEMTKIAGNNDDFSLSFLLLTFITRPSNNLKTIKEGYENLGLFSLNRLGSPIFIPNIMVIWEGENFHTIVIHKLYR